MAVKAKRSPGAVISEIRGDWMKNFLQKNLDDMLIMTGAGLVVYGAYLLSPVAAVFTAGVFLIIFGVLVGLGTGRKGGGNQ